jgi:ubiquinone/menaquinone biosynthesis C-methylase UbiE
MAAEQLHYRDRQFDAVYGNAVMHHVRLSKACPELRRVMKVFPFLRRFARYVVVELKNKSP